MKNRKIAVLMGGLSSERGISLRSGNACLKALLNKGYDAVPLDVDRNIAQRLKAEKIEMAFIALHGRFGEDGSIQGMLEVMGIPYTGSAVMASSIGIDKMMTKRLLRSADILTPRSFELKEGEPVDFLDISKIQGLLPLVVKPSREGSTIGISIVKDEGEIIPAILEARKYDENVLIEEFVEGREMTVGILDGEPLPLVEVRPDKGFYDFESKYTKGMTKYLFPDDINKKTEGKCKDEALKTYRLLDCKGAARVDIILPANGEPHIIEINTIPGMTEMSLLPMAAGKAGIGFEDLVERILLSAGLYS